MRHCRKIVFLCEVLIISEQDASLATADAEEADIDFQFRLLNENGVPATIFNSSTSKC